jgi:hypothetical protein
VRLRLIDTYTTPDPGCGGPHEDRRGSAGALQDLDIGEHEQLLRVGEQFSNQAAGAPGAEGEPSTTGSADDELSVSAARAQGSAFPEALQPATTPIPYPLRELPALRAQRTPLTEIALEC